MYSYGILQRLPGIGHIYVLQPNFDLSGRVGNDNCLTVEHLDNLAGKGREESIAAIGRIAETIKSEKQKGLVILGLLVAGLFVFGK